MSTEPAPNAPRSAVRAVEPRWTPIVLVALAIAALAGASTVVLAQVTVTDDSLAVSRTCGSGFDTVVDRTGWEAWWARDLDEADSGVRSALVRTELCPGAVDRRIALSGALASAGVLLLLGAGWSRRGARARLPLSPVRGGARRIVALGRFVSWAGIGLTLAGLAAIVVLVADADSTLFLYTDRLVVGVVGLLVLMPTLALAALGRLVVLVGEHLDAEESDE